MAFLTCAPNETVGAIHPKAMPVILPEKSYESWLTADYEGASKLAVAYPDGEMVVD